MKLRNKIRRDYEDDGLLPLVNIIFLLLIFYDENKNIYLNDMPINIKGLREKIKTSEIKDVVLIADKSLLVRDINIILFELKQNQINNIKLLSSLNAN